MDGDVTGYLRRWGDDGRGTYGRLEIPGVPARVTVEPPWRANAPWVSCIPPGRYLLAEHRWTKSGELVPMLEDVPGRTFILIHPAAWAEDLAGCIAPGTTWTTREEHRGRSTLGVAGSDGVVLEVLALLAQTARTGARFWLEVE